MARELHSDEIAVEQRAPMDMDNPHDAGEIVLVDGKQMLLSRDYLDELKFMDEEVTIRLQPSIEKNAATTMPVWVNGRGAEVKVNGRFVPMVYLPTGVTFTTKRKYLEPIIRAKIDRVETSHTEWNGDIKPDNKVASFTAPVHSWSIIGDSPKGHEWASEMVRRYYVPLLSALLSAASFVV